MNGIVIRPQHLHPDDILFFFKVAKAMQVIAKKYDLPLKSISGMPEPKGPTWLGDCRLTGDIRLVLRFQNPDGSWTEPRREEDVWGTAAHELAHLRHFNHGVAFQEFEEELDEAVENERGDHTERVLRKLVKMQAQRDGEAAIGNTEAAEAFAGMINKLLIEHELNPSDIDYARASDRDPVVEIEVNRENYKIDRKKTRIAWQESLARVVAKAHLCSFLLVQRTNRIIFVGTKSHATVAEYAYGILVPAAEKMADREYYNYHMGLRREGRDIRLARGFRPAWINAFVDRIGERFQDARRKAVEESITVPGDHSTALVRLEGALVKTREYLDGKFGRKARYAPALNGGRSHHRDGREMGRAAADRMTLGTRGVTGGRTVGQLTS